jgi:hypothetical protein
MPFVLLHEALAQERANVSIARQRLIHAGKSIGMKSVVNWIHDFLTHRVLVSESLSFAAAPTFVRTRAFAWLTANKGLVTLNGTVEQFGDGLAPHRFAYAVSQMPCRPVGTQPEVPL